MNSSSGLHKTMTGMALLGLIGLTAACGSNSGSHITPYSVGGGVAGLSGFLVLQDNSGDNLIVAANGAFTFATRVADNSPYSVTVLTQPTGQSCSVTNGVGTIASANVANVVITCALNAYTIGGTVTGLNGSMVLQDNLGDDLAIAVNGAFTFATPVAHGTPYNVTQLSLQFPNQICAITNGSGTATAAVTGITVNCVKNTTPRFAYVVSHLDDSVSTYAVDAATGRLKYTGKVAAGNTPYSVTVDPSGKYAYVANANSNTLSQYTIGAQGALTAMSPATVAAGTGPASVTVDPSGKYAYVANASSNDVSQYTIGATGGLTPMGPATIAAGTTPYSVTVDPGGKYAYVANASGSSVSQYTIGANGALTAMSPVTVAAGTLPYSVAVDPSGKYAYAANYNGNSVSLYKIGANGALTAMSPATVAGQAGPISLAMSCGTAPAVAVPKYAYVANGGSSNVSQYTMTSDGSLTSMSMASVAAGTNPFSVTVDPSGKYAYVANLSSSNVSQYTIGANGGLAPMSPATVAAGTGPASVTVDPSGKFAYVANGTSNTVSQFTIGTDGALTPMSPAVAAAGTGPASVTVDPSGKFAYAANVNSNTVSQYTIGTDGALTPMSPAVAAAGTGPHSVIVDPTGKYAYVANSNSNSVSQYTIDAYGNLTAMTIASVAAGMEPRSVTIDPSGKYAYAANYGNGVSQYTIGVDGSLTMTIGTVSAGTHPISVATLGTYQ